MLQHLLPSRVQVGLRSSETTTVQNALQAALAAFGAADDARRNNPTDPTTGDLERKAKAWRRRLGALGLRLMLGPERDAWPGRGPPAPGLWVRNGSPAVEALFSGTEWAGGAWEGPLRDLPGAQKSKTSMKFAGGGQDRAVFLPAELLGLDDEHSPAESYAAWSPETAERLGATGRVLRAHASDLSDSPAEFFFNVGSVELLERIARALRPGGGAFLSEYGERSRYPIAGTHLDHLEFSIHFAPLLQVAERLGLEASLHSVQELIGLDRSALTLATTRTYFSSLRAMLAAAGRELDKVAYTREMFQALIRGALELDRIGDVRFHPVDERCMGLAPHEFKALIVRKR